VASDLTGVCLPALIALTALVAVNHFSLWLRHRSERLHLSWAVWCALGVVYLVARALQHTADDAESALFAIRLQYALGLAMSVSLLLVVRDQVQRPPSRRTLIAVAAATALIGAALFLDDVVASPNVYMRTDLLGQRFLDTTAGRLSGVYMALFGVATSVCVLSIHRHGGNMRRSRRLGILLTLGAISAAGMNDLLMAFGLHSIRLTEFATVAIVLAADHLMVHDYHKMVAHMEGLVSERTAALSAVTASARSARQNVLALIDAAPDAVVVTRSREIAFANAAAARFFGHDGRAARVGRDALDLVHPDDRARVRAALEDSLGQSGASPVQEYRYLTDGSATRVADVVMVPLVFEGARSVVSIIRDVTERKQMEEKLQLAERMASLGTLAAGVAHEINNPLSCVLANLEVLRDLTAKTGASETDAEIERLITESEGGAWRVVDIVRDLKAYSRRSDDDPTALIPLEDVLDTAAEMAAVHIRHRARLEREYSGSTMVLGNRGRLDQVFLNLVINAAQAIPQADDPADHRIVLRTYVDGDGMPVAEVEDSGIGIDPALRPRIFDPFFTTRPVGFGTGLGLSSALGIVTALGGRIEVNSCLGTGTTMRVRFPRLSADAPARSVAGNRP